MNSGSDARLREELERLKRLSGMGLDLNLVWAPNPRGALSGEVKSSSILVYESDEEKAAETLRHEFLDHCVSQAINPYRKVTNILIKLLNENAYKRNEQIVRARAEADPTRFNTVVGRAQDLVKALTDEDLPQANPCWLCEYCLYEEESRKHDEQLESKSGLEIRENV